MNPDVAFTMKSAVRKPILRTFSLVQLMSIFRLNVQMHFSIYSDNFSADYTDEIIVGAFFGGLLLLTLPTILIVR